MKIFEFLRKSRFENRQHSSGSYFPTNISDTDLRDLINKSISIFQENPNASAEQIIALIQSIRDEEMLAIALYRFIPTAYCRLFISEMNYSDSYILVKKGKKVKGYHFSSDRVYLTVLEESKFKFSANMKQENVLPVLLHSSEFNAVNSALNNGSNLKDLTGTASYFIID